MPEEGLVVRDGGDVEAVTGHERPHLLVGSGDDVGRYPVDGVDSGEMMGRRLGQVLGDRLADPRRRTLGYLVLEEEDAADACDAEVWAVHDEHRSFGESTLESAHRTAGSGEIAGGARRTGVETEIAELGDDHALRREMREGLLDHLLGVEVTLREHECSGGRGIVGGVAVRGDEPDDVVEVLRACEEGAAVTPHVVDPGIVDDGTGILLELAVEEPDGDGVQFDGVDVLDAVSEGMLDLVAAGGSDDENASRGSTEGVHRQTTAVREEAGTGGRGAVVSPDGRSPEPVVQQDHVSRELDRVDPEHGAPIRG